MLTLIWGHIANPCMAALTAPTVSRGEVHRSPNRSLIAKIVSLKQASSYGLSPSRIEIRRAGGSLKAGKSYRYDRGQGYTVTKCGWTADSRFFVYLVESSGGHGPWCNPIFFYSRKWNRFYSLDDAIHGAITGDMKLRKPCTLLTKGRYFGESRKGLRARLADPSGDMLLTIDLRQLEARLNRGKKHTKPH